MSRKNRQPTPVLDRLRPEPPAAFAGKPTQAGDADPTDAVRTRAYYKWVEAGCPPGDGVNFWLEAEEERRASSPGVATGG